MCKIHNFRMKKTSQIGNCHSLIKYKAYKWKSTRKMTVEKNQQEEYCKEFYNFTKKNHDEEKINEKLA